MNHIRARKHPFRGITRAFDSRSILKIRAGYIEPADDEWANIPEYTGSPSLVHRRLYKPADFRAELTGLSNSMAGRIRELASGLRKLESRIRAPTTKKVQVKTVAAKSPLDDREARKQMEKFIQKVLGKYFEKDRVGNARYYLVRGGIVRPWKPAAAERTRLRMGFAAARQPRLAFLRRRFTELRGSARASGAMRALQRDGLEYARKAAPGKRSIPGPEAAEMIMRQLEKRPMGKSREAPAANPLPMIRESVAREVREHSRAEFNSLVEGVYRAIQRKLYVERERRRR